jgi:hypothetical protein
MIHLQVIPRVAEDLKPLIRAAIKDGRIRSFYVDRVKGGLRLKHQKHPGRVQIESSKGPLLCTVLCKASDQEWQLLDAFVGRLVYHFRADIAGINIQLNPSD